MTVFASGRVQVGTGACKIAVFLKRGPDQGGTGASKKMKACSVFQSKVSLGHCKTCGYSCAPAQGGTGVSEKDGFLFSSPRLDWGIQKGLLFQCSNPRWDWGTVK